VAQKLEFVTDVLGADRVLMHLSVGTMPHPAVMRAVELLADEVAPRVRAHAAARAEAASPVAMDGRAAPAID
jgi:hypothetical protein